MNKKFTIFYQEVLLHKNLPIIVFETLHSLINVERLTIIRLTFLLFSVVKV